MQTTLGSSLGVAPGKSPILAVWLVGSAVIAASFTLLSSLHAPPLTIVDSAPLHSTAATHSDEVDRALKGDRLTGDIANPGAARAQPISAAPDKGGVRALVGCEGPFSRLLMSAERSTRCITSTEPRSNSVG